MNETILALTKVTAHREKKLVLNIEQLSVARGELVAIIGPNGAGKSTLLQVINSLLPYSTGCIRLYGRRIDEFDRIELRRRCAMVFQEPLFAKDSVYNNVALPLRLRGLAEKGIMEKVHTALRVFQCGHLVKRLAHHLSGGEAQRVCLARAFVTCPELLLLDEPFTALDPATRNDLLGELRQVALQTGMTVLLISHNLGDVLHFAQRAVVMQTGIILQDGPPEQIMRRPANLAVARLVGMDNVIPCTTHLLKSKGSIRFANGIEFFTSGLLRHETHCCLPGDAFCLRVGKNEANKSWVRVEAIVTQIIPGIGVSQIIADCNGLQLRLKLSREESMALIIGEMNVFFFDSHQAHLI
jgi:tungstate transport system ATP-binding protein